MSQYRFLPLSGVKGLLLLLMFTLLLTLLMATQNTTADILFQSPQSVVKPTNPPKPTSTTKPIPTTIPSPTHTPLLTPSPQIPTTEIKSEGSSTVQPTSEQQSTLPPTTEQLTPPSSQPSETATSAPSPILSRSEPAKASLDNKEKRDSPNFILDQAELIDSVIISGAYIWACCGVGTILLVPLLLLFLHIRGRSKIIKQENF